MSLVKSLVPVTQRPSVTVQLPSSLSTNSHFGPLKPLLQVQTPLAQVPWPLQSSALRQGRMMCSVASPEMQVGSPTVVAVASGAASSSTQSLEVTLYTKLVHVCSESQR